MTVGRPTGTDKRDQEKEKEKDLEDRIEEEEKRTPRRVGSGGFLIWEVEIKEKIW